MLKKEDGRAEAHVSARVCWAWHLGVLGGGFSVTPRRRRLLRVCESAPQAEAQAKHN